MLSNTVIRLSSLIANLLEWKVHIMGEIGKYYSSYVLVTPLKMKMEVEM